MNWVARRLNGRIHYGWVAVGVVFFVLLAAAGTRATPSVMMLPLEKQFGWSAVDRVTVGSSKNSAACLTCYRSVTKLATLM